jgi:hypothetical protein
MNVVLRFNLFEKEQWAKLCALKVSQRRTIETLKKSPQTEKWCALWHPIVSFSKCIMTKQVVYDSEPFRLGSSLRIQSVQEKAESSVTLSRHVAYFFRPRQRQLFCF